MNGFIKGQGQLQARSGKALVFAWLLEAVAVIMGLILAVFAGIEGSDGGVIAISIAILPFAALSVVELTKIPLVGLAFQVRSLVWRVIAVCALLLVTVATFENFVFGFERGFNERIRSVEVAEQAVAVRQSELDIANTRLPQLTARQGEITTRLGTLRDEVAGIRQQARQDIDDARTSNTGSSYSSERAEAEKELAGLDGRREAALNAERVRCRSNPDTRCNISAIAGGFQRQRDGLAKKIANRTEEQHKQDAASGADQANARQRRDASLAGLDRERTGLEQELDAVREHLIAAHTVSLQGSNAVAQTARQRDAMIERSQLHRLADVLFGDHQKDTLEKTKRAFVVSLAAIVAMVGSLIAAMHYAAQNERGQRRGLIGKAIRGYVARHRRAIPVHQRRIYTPKERAGFVRNLRGWAARRRRGKLPVVVREVVKEVPVDRLKIVFLPLDATEEQIAKAREDARREFVATPAKVAA